MAGALLSMKMPAWSGFWRPGAGPGRDSPGRPVSRKVGLGGLLSDIAEAHQRNRAELRKILSGWDVDAYLDGTKVPGRDFVHAFLNVIAGDSPLIREGLEHLVWPTWQAAQEQGHGSGDAAAGASVLVQVTAEAGVLLTVNQQAAEASRTAGRLQESATALESWRASLVFTLGKYATAVDAMAAERDKLTTRLAAEQGRARDQEASRAAQAAAMADELRDVRARLAVTVQQRDQVSQQLAATERQLRAAKHLLDEAQAQATRSRRRLAGIEHRPASASLVAAPAASSDPYRLMGDADQRLGEEIIHRTEDFLRAQDAALSRHAATIAQLRKSAGRSARVPLSAAVVVAVVLATAIGLTVAALPGGRTAPSLPYRSVTLTDTGTETHAAAAAFNPAGTLLAVGDGDGSTYLWNPATGKVTATLADPGRNSEVKAVAFNSAGPRSWRSATATAARTCGTSPPGR